VKNGTKQAKENPQDFDLGPQPPHSLSAEVAILGAILLDNAAWFQTETLTQKDFYLHSHRVIYRCMAELASDGKKIDFVTLTEVLSQHNELEMVGGVRYVTGLTDGLPRVKNIEQYIEIVKEKSSLRELIKISQDAIQGAYENEPAEQLIAETDRRICEIQGASKNDGPRHASVVVTEIRTEVERVRALDPEQKYIGYTTGCPILDETTLGYHKGEMALIAGETSSGKSTLMRQGVFANLHHGIRSLVYTYEVKGRPFITNLLSPTSCISGTKLRDFRKLDDQAHILGKKSEMQVFNEHLSNVGNWPLWIEDNSKNNHIDHVCASARAMIRRHGIEMVWLDQVSLVRSTGQTEVERYEYISKCLVSLANSENVPVIVLSQFNRDKERQGGKRPPRKGDIKWAGRLEEDANTEIFVWEEETDKHWLIIAKQRSGATGKLAVTFDRSILWFEDGHSR
jgi:replicative DNA helicase